MDIFGRTFFSCSLFDFSVDFPEPGNEQRETLESGLFSSKSGGFTGVGIQPTYQPARDKKSEILFCKNSTKDFGIDVVPFGAISKDLKGEQLAEMFDMYNAGALAFSDNMRPVHNSGLFSRALLYAKNFNGLIISFPYEEKISPNVIAVDCCKSNQSSILLSTPKAGKTSTQIPNTPNKNNKLLTPFKKR